MNSVRKISKTIARALRDFWIAAGIALVFFVVVEVAYRAQSEIRHRVRVRSARNLPRGPTNPFESTTWWKDYWVDHGRVVSTLDWEPYLYVRNPTFSGKVISVDSLGHRVTPVPPSAAVKRVRIFFFGGSTTFGWFQRNEHTIPAETSRRLQDALGGQAGVDPTNFGVPGRVFAQEVFELILQLRKGERPDVVVFFDGINEVVAAVDNGQTGVTLNEINRAEDFRRGRELFEAADPGLANDRKWAGRVLRIAADRVQFVRSIARHMHPSAAPVSLISTDSAARGIVSTYSGTVGIVEALSRQYGFQPIYVWQPVFLTMKKPLTVRETYLLHALSRWDLPQIRDLHVMLPPLISAAVRPIAGSRFIDETSIFMNDSLDVYEDAIGHTYERAIPGIVDSIMPAVTAAARRALGLPADSLAGAKIH
ncbi:MAG TPA: SGNH/GDSL hydrolase family protein [Gemmatimonadaceae bacterium]|nr:SGNH/GDSL hydrolase family protein [Gemmatimonadaceae bacterium]